jgi:hypothetical protein
MPWPRAAHHPVEVSEREPASVPARAFWGASTTAAAVLIAVVITAGVTLGPMQDASAAMHKKAVDRGLAYYDMAQTYCWR